MFQRKRSNVVFIDGIPRGIYFAEKRAKQRLRFRLFFLKYLFYPFLILLSIALSYAIVLLFQRYF